MNKMSKRIDQNNVQRNDIPEHSDWDELLLDLDRLQPETEHAFSDEHNRNMDLLFDLWEKEAVISSQSKALNFRKVTRSYLLIASILFVFLIGMSILHTDSFVLYANRIGGFLLKEFEIFILIPA